MLNVEPFLEIVAGSRSRGKSSPLTAKRPTIDEELNDLPSPSAAETAPSGLDCAPRQHVQQQRVDSRVEVPYGSTSIIVAIALVAFISPFLTAALQYWDLYLRHDYNNYDLIDVRWGNRHRLLEQSYNCTGPTDSTTNDATWDSVRVIGLVALFIGGICLVCYEIFRRDPIIGKYCFDRKRLSRPDRTPPPLMLSRSLWRGGEGGTAAQCTWGCRVLPALFELVFLTLDENYVKYAERANKARLERESKGFYKCCAAGWYHNNCINTRKRDYKYDNDDIGTERSAEGLEYIDEDGYVFYPGYRHVYSYVREDIKSIKSKSYRYIVKVPYSNDRLSVDMGSSISTSAYSKVSSKRLSMLSAGSGGESRRDLLRSAKTRALFPEDFSTSRLDDGIYDSKVRFSDMTEENNYDNQSHSDGIDNSKVRFSNATEEYNDKNHSHSDGIDNSKEVRFSDAIEEHYNENHSRSFGSVSTYCTADDGGENHERNEQSAEAESLVGTNADGENGMESAQDTKPQSTTTTAIRNKNADSPPLYENDDMESERYLSLVKHLHGISTNSITSSNSTKPVRHHNIPKSVSFQDDASESAGNKTEEDENAAANVQSSNESSIDSYDENEKLKYPYRLPQLLLPLGFHSWADAYRFLHDFFGFKSEQSHDYSALGVSFPGRDIPCAEKELLRCVGLDTYMMIRSARFCYDATFYPFLIACVTVVPIYLSYQQDEDRGYLTLTIIRIPAGDSSGTFGAVLAVTAILYLYVMRRLWWEWEVFIKLRYHFIMEGDDSLDQRPAYRKKYRNTCMVECVPKSHRSDATLREMFETLFPGQIEHAEMLIDTSKLEDIVRERKKYITKFDEVDASYRYALWKYDQKQDKGSCCGMKTIAPPEEPMVWPKSTIFPLSCWGKKENALAYYSRKIMDLEELADQEYDNITKLRRRWHSASLFQTLPDTCDNSSSMSNAFKSIYEVIIPMEFRRKYFGEEVPFFCGTGMVTFKSNATKQSAVQCNLSGHPYFNITTDVPDPRDIVWANVVVEKYLSDRRETLVNVLLFVGIFGWGAFVTWITEITNLAIGYLPSYIPAAVMQAYLPVLAVATILLWIPYLFHFVALKYICFKSYSQCDEFTLKWNTGYRLANIFLNFFSVSLLQFLTCFSNDPDGYIKTLGDLLIRQSAFLMSLMILATGQETMFMLLQWRTLGKQAIIRPLTNFNAKSRRYLDWLDDAWVSEKTLRFGLLTPPISYGLVIAMVFAFMVPMMLGVCAAFFWITTKVHTHNALYCYVQKNEGGGRLFYYFNRIVLIGLYSSIIVFSGIFALRSKTMMALCFLVIMLAITYGVDSAMKKTFVIHSINLPISIARIHNEEMLSQSNLKSDGEENFMYRHPVLNQHNWDTIESILAKP
mmetsp:Transcript_26962/g.56923  ORF Transcript_26962/g.56923 Transcript_26962/m.56923 type:complete len:1388 (-) Transcript_26962:191-4354(-)